MLIEGEGDARQRGIGRGNDDNEEVGEGVVACGADRNTWRWMGSSLLRMAGGSGPVSEMAY